MLTEITENSSFAFHITRAVENHRTVGQKLTRSDLNFFASDPMSGAIFQ